MQVRYDEGLAIHIGPEPCVRHPRGCRRSVGRGAHRPAIEPRKIQIPGADAVSNAEGNTDGRAIASAWTARRGRRPWHVRKLLVREPGDLMFGRRQDCPVRIGKARSRSR